MLFRSPRLDGDAFPVSLRASRASLRRIFSDRSVSGEMEPVCPPPGGPPEEIWNQFPCDAGHASCYISPAGNVMPCVQFPLICGNLRESGFQQIWNSSPGFAAVRRVRMRDLPVCSDCPNVGCCARCPGLALADGDMLGPSRLDCEVTYARTNVPPPVPIGDG